MSEGPDQVGATPVGPQRLQKVLAAAGVGSRRKCEVLIAAGRVKVDGQVVARQGMQVDPALVQIQVDGKVIPTQAGLVVLMLNKPKGMLSAMSDDRGRPCVGDLVTDRHERLFHVGRLDADTTGLLLLTNDGELAQRLSHPSYEVVKTYRATVEAPIAKSVARRLRAGVDLEDGPARADSFHVVTTLQDRAIVQISLHEGRKHIVRRMLAAVGHPVLELVRTRIGSLSLDSLKPGQLKELPPAAVRKLYGESVAPAHE
ncbi:MAG: rRNA pseudouridine synthase [Actinomycetia bacterium]|nr:rRNA pseudouridine synthase [Actinomycetes bacterium]